MPTNSLLSQADRALGLSDPTLAFNLSGVNDWAPQLPFLDISQSMRSWIGYDTNWEDMSADDIVAGGYLDENGWVDAIPDDMVGVRTVWAPAAGRATIWTRT